MNKSMYASAIRMAVIFIGGFLAAKGLVTADLVDRLSDLNTIGQVLGAVATVWSVVIGLKARTTTAIVDSAAKLPGVSSVQVTDPKLVDKTDAPNVQIVKSL